MTLEEIAEVLEDKGTAIACGKLRDNPSRYALVITGDKDHIQKLCSALTGDEEPWGEHE